MNVFSKNTKGFTLVEMLISMSIVTMIFLGMLTINQSNIERGRREAFQTDLESILAMFRVARSNAISNSTVGGEVPNAYGVYLQIADNASSLDATIFADTNDASGTGTADNQFNEGYDTILSTKHIPLIWAMHFVNPNPSSITLDKTLTTLFLPPNSEMIINDNDATHDLVSAEIAGAYKTLSKRICINRVSQFFEVLTGESCS